MYSKGLSEITEWEPWQDYYSLAGLLIVGFI